MARNFCSYQARPASPGQRLPCLITPSLISSRQKMWRRGSGAGGSGRFAQSAFSSGISHRRMRVAARPADSGWCLRLYWARMKSKPSVAMSVRTGCSFSFPSSPLTLMDSTRSAAFSPRNVSDVQSS